MTLNTDLEALYHFTGDVTDSSGNGRDGTNLGTTSVADKNSVSGQARNFVAASSQSIDIGAVTDFAYNIGSISVWFKTTSASTVQYIVSRDGGTPRSWISLLSGSKFIFQLRDASDVEIGQVTSTNNVIDNTWVHFVMTWDSSTVKLYRDGVFDVSDTQSGTVRTTDAQCEIGARTNSVYFDGVIDEVRIYSRAISEDEVLQLYKGYDTDAVSVTGTQTINNELYYKLDVSEDPQTDSTGNGNTGTVTSATYTASGKINGGYAFDGSNDTITYPDLGIFTGSVNFTVSFWIKMNDTGSDGVFSAGHEAFFRLANQTTQALAYHNGSWRYIALSSLLSTSVFEHIVITYDSVTGMKLYRNNSLEGSHAAVGITAYTGFTNSIGSYSTGYSNCTIDEVSIWSRVLTTDERTALYNSGDGLQYPYGETVAVDNALYIDGGL